MNNSAFWPTILKFFSFGLFAFSLLVIRPFDIVPIKWDIIALLSKITFNTIGKKHIIHFMDFIEFSYKDNFFL